MSTEASSDHYQEPEVNRANTDVEFYNRPVVRPLEIELNGETYTFMPDNCYVVLYKYAPSYNRIVYLDENQQTTNIYDNPVLAEWLAGFKWDDSNPTRVMNRGKTMHDVCGWEADVVIRDYPDEGSKGEYELANCYDLYGIGELTVKTILEIGKDEDEENS